MDIPATARPPPIALNTSLLSPSTENVYWNASGFSNFLNDFDLFSNFDVICISESWLNYRWKPLFTHRFDNFVIFQSLVAKTKHTGRASGGLVTFVKKSAFHLKLIFTNEHLLFVELKKDDFVFVVGSDYISPLEDTDRAFTNFDIILNRI